MHVAFYWLLRWACKSLSLCVPMCVPRLCVCVRRSNLFEVVQNVLRQFSQMACAVEVPQAGSWVCDCDWDWNWACANGDNYVQWGAQTMQNEQEETDTQRERERERGGTIKKQPRTPAANTWNAHRETNIHKIYILYIYAIYIHAQLKRQLMTIQGLGVAALPTDRRQLKLQPPCVVVLVLLLPLLPLLPLLLLPILLLVAATGLRLMTFKCIKATTTTDKLNEVRQTTNTTNKQN